MPWRDRRVLSSLWQVALALGTPVNAILLQTGLALAVLFLGAFDRVLSYIIFSAVLFLALTVFDAIQGAPAGARLVVFPWRQSPSSFLLRSSPS